MDNDLGPTVCHYITNGSVLCGGFTIAGVFVPLRSGHIFVFEGTVPHGMAEDAVDLTTESLGAVRRYSTASFLSARLVNKGEADHNKIALARLKNSSSIMDPRRVKRIRRRILKKQQEAAPE